jgi:AcrR family transcriptional regulator
MPKAKRKPTAAPPARALRGDAARNRERLLAVATDAFAGSSSQVSLEAVAREAGVGIGTLYRHFPTREALVEAVYLSQLDRLVASGTELLAAAPPDRALRAWMDRFVDWVEGKQGMKETLRAMFAGGSLDRSEMQARMIATIDAFLAAGAEAGVLRADRDGSDVLRSMIGLVSVGAAAPDRSALDRTLDLLVDGLRFGAQ